jgi:TolB protein
MKDAARGFSEMRPGAGSRSKPARSRFGRFAAAIALSVAVSSPAFALLELDINRGNTEPLPIAIPIFAAQGGQAELAANITAVVTANLRRSGIFAPADPSTFIQQNVDPNAAPRFGDWRIIGTQALVTGGVVAQSGGQVRVEVRLWDVFANEQMIGQSFVTSPENWRRVAHMISDMVYETLTGEPGYFNSQIIFVDETGPKDNRIKRLAVMDQDGANLSFLTGPNEYQLVVTPRFSPNSQDVTYMAYPRTGSPRVVLYNTLTGQEEVLGNFPGTTLAPRFSPDGSLVIMSLLQGPNANIFTYNVRTGGTQQLTDTAAINTSPSYSPDGRQIVFTSDLGGNAQIYVMNADGTNRRLISRGDGTYSTPVWSPRGDLIAFTKQSGGYFEIGVMRPDGGGERILTSRIEVQEGPSWSPNGRALIFTREIPGENGGPQLWSIDLTGYNEIRIPTPNYASDPSWSPLRN